MPVVNDKIWQGLATHQRVMANQRMIDLFDRDPERAQRYRISAAGLTLDYSKNLINDDSLNLFSRLIDANTLPQRVHEMFDGERVNLSENRQALHTLLRIRSAKRVPENLTHEADEVAHALARVDAIASAVRNGDWTGHNGKPVRNVVHIGIGGSYLGPRMAAEALTPYRSGNVECHYVAN
ncbi:MAG TPA: glucose-6-phosphate isomerase, partial [Pseudomonadales bacterium]|nr:glucose-6-phosphate isomerase [Pseudomonadales bacterium]